ncbi:MAG TPA: spore cortex-lytic enzyme [Pseudogracilibacillus sp.]|nr:spore cortex-lytic enzyme [Pseudogracilibacillus sp.]
MNVKQLSLLFTLFISITLCINIVENKQVNAFTDQVIQHGAVGEDVIELQARLKHIGFFTGEIDGVFGWRTYWALRHFQYEFGLPIDGMAGEKTKEKLVKATEYNPEKVKQEMYGTASTPSKPQGEQAKEQGTKQEQTEGQGQGDELQTKKVNVPQGFSQNDINLMANAVYGEARGEPYEGQVAVAAVILNRVQSSTFPNTISGVIFEPRAFTAVADGQIWLTPNEKARQAVLDAINGWDPSGNALYYFNPDTATSGWIWTRPQIKQIGKHIFCK